MARQTRWGSAVFFGVIALIGIGFVSSIVNAWLTADDWKPGQSVEAPPSDGKLHPVVIRKPGGVPMVDSGEVDAQGNPVMVACGTCHDTREPNYEATSGEQLVAFHQGLSYEHGGQTCLSCHHEKDYGSLRLADGRRLEFSESMALCAQCHPIKHRDYQAGRHGGMTGYWDLTRGGRKRNSCVDCHDPHRPAYPKVLPVFPPQKVIGEAAGAADH